MTDHDVPTSVGGYLRQLREAKAGSLGEIARATRVSVYQLEALESDRFEELPASVFVKGFIRAYCDFLGQPADEALRRYKSVIGERPGPSRPLLPARRSPLFWIGSPVFISFALFVVFGAGLLAVNAAIKRGRTPAVSQPVPVARVNPSPPPAVPSVSVSPVASSSAESPAPQRLLVRAIEPTWIRIQTDDLHAVQELLSPGATREWTAERRFLLTVGNAGGIEIELNGRPMPRLGESGKVIRQIELPKAAAAGP
jgi:cytoskeleton protein RodZ